VADAIEFVAVRMSNAAQNRSGPALASAYPRQPLRAGLSTRLGRPFGMS
jgi:hypothetical protein